MANDNLAHIENLCHQLLEHFQAMGKLLPKLGAMNIKSEIALGEVMNCVQAMRLARSEGQEDD